MNLWALCGGSYLYFENHLNLEGFKVGGVKADQRAEMAVAIMSDVYSWAEGLKNQDAAMRERLVSVMGEFGWNVRRVVIGDVVGDSVWVVECKVL